MFTENIETVIQLPFSLKCPYNGVVYTRAAVESIVENFDEPIPLNFNIGDKSIPLGLVVDIHLSSTETSDDVVILECVCNMFKGGTTEFAEILLSDDSLKTVVSSTIKSIGLIGVETKTDTQR